ncbi:uncharacterized protein LOC114864111 isoform X2 [Betta splendens]|uniref:Uncharacterized protein LOC114864111 isoform X2 n=1 Tax=Betta splendens TaxID=158456 RepID=A0A6P7NRE0_BETSP|nr:uncharacterized protein LOC114864111 isoform X2 [Betta splendens]
MIVRLAALILLSTLSHTQDVPEQMLLVVAESGQNLTLTCTVTDTEFGMFYWYKLNFGFMVQTVASGTFNTASLQGQFDNSRFTFSKSDAQFFLHIRNVSKADEATYFCQAGTSYTMRMLNGTLLAVNDKKLQEPNYVLQKPDTVSVGPGSSVTLQCSVLSKEDDRDQCSEEHRVYWFRGGAHGFNPGFVHTPCTDGEDGGRRSCSYSFSKTIQDSSDAGTYYCAVVTCTQILFGEGTNVETRPFWPLLTLGVLLGCCVIVIVFLIVSRKQKVCEPCNGNSAALSQTEQDRTAENQPSDTSEETGPLSYVVLDFPSRRPKRLRNKVELPEESLYALMRD